MTKQQQRVLDLTTPWKSSSDGILRPSKATNRIFESRDRSVETSKAEKQRVERINKMKHKLWNGGTVAREGCEDQAGESNGGHIWDKSDWKNFPNEC